MNPRKSLRSIEYMAWIGYVSLPLDASLLHSQLHKQVCFPQTLNKFIFGVCWSNTRINHILF